MPNCSLSEIRKLEKKGKLIKDGKPKGIAKISCSIQLSGMDDDYLITNMFKTFEMFHQEV